MPRQRMMTAVQLPGHRFLESVLRIDRQLAEGASTFLLNEHAIESLWETALRLKCGGPWYWLLLARLAEAALLCAGHYADSCEYRAAGDFLVNPREIRVIDRRSGSSAIKNRHGRLSEQFGMEGDDRKGRLKEFAGSMLLETTKLPLLPHMALALRASGCISEDYLQRLELKQCRIAGTLAFLAAWRIENAAELWRRMLTAPAGEREFVESNLCRFNRRTFQRLGTDLHRSLTAPDYQSPFLIGRYPGHIPRRPKGSVAVHAVPVL
jgi:hypothetical protein